MVHRNHLVQAIPEVGPWVAALAGNLVILEVGAWELVLQMLLEDDDSPLCPWSGLPDSCRWIAHHCSHSHDAFHAPGSWMLGDDNREVRLGPA